MRMAAVIPPKEIERIVQGEHPDPFRWLGPHPVPGLDGSERVVRVFDPDADEVWVEGRGEDGPVAMKRLDDAGLFEATIADGAGPTAYRVRKRYGEKVHEAYDAYAFPSTLGDVDLYLLGEGSDQRLYRKLGAHPIDVDGVRGVRFAVWAPNAQRVSVVGPFNVWDGRRNPMRLHPGAGVWEIFIPGIDRGELYKFEIKPRQGAPFLKADPVAFYSEVRPDTGSVVHGLTEYHWSDGEWMARRGAFDATREAMAVYEVHLGSWRRGEGDRMLSYRELAKPLADYVQEMGFTHIELLPISEHPYDPSWGYQVTGYFAPTSRFGMPDDFRYFVDHMHQRGIGVILDWVPAHFPKDAHALRRFDGTALYEHADPRQGEHPDWGTHVFNFGRNEVRNFLVSNALYWLEEFHIDGLRVDAVASMLYLDYSREAGAWVPNQYGGRENLEAIDFIKHLNHTVRERVPGALMIAEESTAWPAVTQPVEFGGLGFHLKWNMGWMNDFLRFIEQDPVHRKYHFGLLTFSLMYAFSEKFVLPFSHDEVVHGKHSLLEKMPGDAWQKHANLRLALGMMWGHPGKQLLFMGCEIGQVREWSESRSLDWHVLDDPLHRGLQRWVRDLNRVYRAERALWACDFDPRGFEWIDFHDIEQSVISFVRRGENPGEEIVFVCNFTPVPREGYRVGAPAPGYYREVLNSDAAVYGGGGVGNDGGVASEAVSAQGREHSISLNLPPLGILLLKREQG
jgi:1,4-alpha-glucan branching enzyme